jgi:hypothetical protein
MFFRKLTVSTCFCLLVLNRPEIVDAERDPQKENHQQSLRWSDDTQGAGSVTQEKKYPRIAHRQRGSGYAFGLGISGHHVELREVVEAVHEEKAASYDPPDEERNVMDARHKPLLIFITCGRFR